MRSQKRGKVLRNDETSEEKEPSEINWRKEGEIKTFECSQDKGINKYKQTITTKSLILAQDER